MTLYSKKEEFQVDLGQFGQKLLDWDIKARIVQKIDVWNLKYNQIKIQLLPVKFVCLVMKYFFIKNYKENIYQYHSALPAQNLHELKQLYNILSIDKFKKATIFQYCLLIIIKLYHYFITYHYPHLISKVPIDEQDHFKAIIAVLIGYEVDSRAYELLLGKYGVVNVNKQESPRISGQLMGCQVLDGGNHDEVYYNYSSKKIHRKGRLNYFLGAQDQQQFQSFLGEVKKALYVQKKLQKMKKQESRLNKKLGQNSQKHAERIEWTKLKRKILRTDQISASMAIHNGFQMNNKAMPSIQISPRKIMAQFDNCLKKQDPSKMISCLPKDNIQISKQKNWNQIIKSMKTDHSQDSFRTPQLTKQMNSTNFLLNLEKQNNVPLSNPGDHLKKEELYYLTSVKSPQLQYVQYHPKPNKQNVIHKPLTHIRNNSNSTLYFKQKSSFLKDCQSRKNKVNDVYTYLPSIQRH